MKSAFSLTSFLGGLVLGAALVGAWVLGNAFGGMRMPTSSFNLDGEASTTTEAPVGTPSGAVEVHDQPAGPTVIIDSVTVSPPGVWIAVREVADGELSNVLGAALVGGPRADVAVQLLRNTEPGATYAVELYRDNGDNRFDLDTDSVYVDFDSGTRVIDYFKAK